MEDKLTRARYADYKGVTRQMVNQWNNEGRLVLTDDKKYVLVKESDELINLTSEFKNTFYDQRKKPVEEKLVELTEEVSKTQLDLETDNADLLFKNSRALKEKAAALQAAAEHSRFIGELIEKEQVNKIIFERARQFRDGLMACSRRIAPEISGIDDIQELEKVLTREFRSILDNFSKLPVIE